MRALKHVISLRRSPLTAEIPSSRLGRPCGFRGGRNWVSVGFSRGFSRFPYREFHSTNLSTLSHAFSFISLASLMVR